MFLCVCAWGEAAASHPHTHPHPSSTPSVAVIGKNEDPFYKIAVFMK